MQGMVGDRGVAGNQSQAKESPEGPLVTPCPVSISGRERYLGPGSTVFKGHALRRLHDAQGGWMISKLLVLAVTLALPTLAAAQTPHTPNEHASDRAKAMVATHRRGEVIAVPHTRNPNAATRAVRAKPPAPGHGLVPNVPAKRATPAVPANKGGQSGNHRP
jgi:hypothetical protein